MIELILLRDDDRNGGTMHKRSMINPQQASRTVTTTLKFSFNQGSKKHKFLIWLTYLKQICAYSTNTLVTCV